MSDKEQLNDGYQPNDQQRGYHPSDSQYGYQPSDYNPQGGYQPEKGSGDNSNSPQSNPTKSD